MEFSYYAAHRSANTNGNKVLQKVGIRFLGNFEYVSRETYLLFFVLSLCSPHAYIIMGT